MESAFQNPNILFIKKVEQNLLRLKPIALNLLLALILLICGNLNLSAQTGSWMKTIKDSASAYYFSNPFYIEEDSLNMHVLSNTGLDPNVICGPLNGSIYYLKINKQNGAVVSTCRISGGGNTMRGINAKLIKGNIYISATVTSPFYLNLGMLLKFNTSSFLIPWTKMFQVFTNNPSYLDVCVSSKFQTNLAKDKLYFFANKAYSNQSLGQLSTFARGGIDTSGNFFYGTQGVLPTFTVPNAPYATYNNIDFIHLLPTARINLIGQNYISGKVAIFSINTQTLLGPYVGKELSVRSDGNNFVGKVGAKILYVMNDSTGTNCIITDTINNILMSKKVQNLYCRAVAFNDNSSILTMVNSLNGIHGDHIYNLRVDSSLNLLMARKMFLDTFRLAKFNCKSFMDSLHFTNVFNFPTNLSKDIYIHRQRFNTLSCNEVTFTPQINTTNISTISAIITATGTTNVTSYTISAYPKGFKDSVYCFVGETPYPIANVISNSVCLGGISSLSVSFSGSPTAFNWNFQNATISSSSILNPTLAFNSSGVQIATITAVNFYGSATSTASIRVWPIPTVSINSGSICLGQNYTLQPSGAFTYTFLGTTQIVSPTVNTTYSVIGTSSNGCQSNNVALAQISVWQAPTLIITPNKTLVCIGDGYSLTASGCNTYTWSTGAQGNIANFIGQQQQINSVECTDINGCKSSTQYKISTSFCVGFSSNTSNYFEDMLGLKWNEGVLEIRCNLKQAVYLEIYDTGGKLIFRKKTENYLEAFDFNGLSKGIYLLQIFDGTKTQRNKLCYF